MQKPTCILIVDDEPDILDALQDVLSSFDYEVLTAERPSLALEMVGKKQVDIVICDINMPVLNGYGFITGYSKHFADQLSLLNWILDHFISMIVFASKLPCEVTSTLYTDS